MILVGRWTRAELTATTRTLHDAGCAIGRPLLLMVDQEGGFARRLTWAEPTDTAGALGRLGVARTRAEASRAAVELAAAGIDVDLAPVTDTLAPGGFLGARSFGSDPLAVGSSPRRSSGVSRRIGSRRRRSTSPGSARRATRPTTIACRCR